MMMDGLMDAIKVFMNGVGVFYFISDRIFYLLVSGRSGGSV